MRIRPTHTRPSSRTAPATARRRVQLRRRGGAAAAAIATLVALLNPTPASAATVTLSLNAAVVSGDPSVTFTGSVTNNPGDSLALCFGDVTCTATAGSTATSAAALSAGVAHAYPAEGSYQATLYDVTAGSVTASATAAVAVTIDATARLTATTNGLSATLDGSSSTALPNDTWGICFGDTPTCSPTTPDQQGTVSSTSPVASKILHIYTKPGQYTASLTVNGTKAPPSTVALVVSVNYLDPAAVLTADRTSGTGSLPVILDGSKSVSGPTDTWALCFGDVGGCTQAKPNLSGTGPVTLPTTAHSYPPGNFTATLWVSNGTSTTSATVSIAVGNTVAAPDGTCTLTGVIRTCDLFAKATGSVTVGTGASGSIPFWGFTTSDTATPVLGGPTLIATQGERLAFTVHNQLDPKAGNVAITVPALIGVPDLSGVAPGATGPSGAFTLTTPGTYIYEAGLTPGGERQVAMGMSGLLIVRPSVTNSANSARCAYTSATAATDCVAGHDSGNYFDREKTVVVTELDEKFNADPFATDTGNYHPTRFFLDGVAYDPAKAALDPSSPTFSAATNNVRFDAAPGETVLLRYADLGLREHSLNLMNLLQTETARDAHLLPGTHVQNTEFLNAGQTADTFLTIPADAVTGTQYPLYDAGFHLNNGTQGGLRGMYAYLNVINGQAAAALGPIGTAASATPTFDASTPNLDNSQIPTVAVTAAFTAQPPTAGAAAPNVKSVQWALDGVPGPTGLWQPSGATPAAAPTASVSFTITADVLRQLLGTEPDRVFGDHTIWLQATDTNGKPGPALGAVFTLATRDPVISALSIDPQVTNGTTRSNQLPVASTTVSSLSNLQTLPRSTINVKSTAGFPATCTPQPINAGCLITVGMTIADGPAQNAIVYAAFTYTGTTATSFTGVSPVTPIAANTYQLRTGNTIALDVVPAGYIALNATATASLPGFVIQAAQACILYAPTPIPGPANNVQSSCKPALTNVVSRNVFDLTVTPPGLGTPPSPAAPLAAVNGFIPAPTLPDGVRNAGKFWVMVRAQEGPDGTPCTIAGACRWSPWLYYNPVHTTVTVTRALAEDNVYVTSTAGFPGQGQLSAIDTANQSVTINYQATNPTTFLTNNGGGVPGTLAAGTIVTGSAADPATYQTLTLVKVGPTTSKVSVSPNPNNGFGAAAGNLGLVDSFDVTASVASQWANIALAETFLAPSSRPAGTAPPTLRRCVSSATTPVGCIIFGQGAEMTPADGFWNNSLTKDVTAFLPLSELQGMTDGLVRVWVHAKDSAGNWGPFQATDLVLDRTAPVVNSATNTAPAASTTTAAAASLPLAGGTLALASAAGLPATGSIAVATSSGVQVLTYTGVSANTLTGVSGGTPASTVALGAAVTAFTGIVSVTAHDAYSVLLKPPNATGTNGVSSGVSRAEWFVGADPGPGNATPAVTTPVILTVIPNSAQSLTFTISALPAGKTVWIRVADAAGNWSSAMAVTL